MGNHTISNKTNTKNEYPKTYVSKSQNTEREKIAAEILAVLGTEKAKLNDMVETRATYFEAINKVFKSMTWDFYKSQEDTYLVTFTGTYYPNYQVVQYTQEGNLQISVNLKTGNVYGLSGDAAPGINVYLASRF